MINPSFRAAAVRPSLLICFVVLAHVVMVHSAHAGTPSDLVGIHAPAHHASNGAAILVAPTDVADLIAGHEDDTCPPPAWVAQRFNLLADAGLVDSAPVIVDLGAVDHVVPTRVCIDLPWPAGPVRQAMLQRFRL